MDQLAKLQDHYRMLKTEDSLLFAEGDWEALAQVRLALDDTLTAIEKLKGDLS